MLLLAVVAARRVAAAEAPDMAEVLARSSASDWRTPDPSDTLYMALPEGTVVLELAPQFAPNVIANMRTLVRSGYFDGGAIVRSQDNYVVQWGDPKADSDGAKSLGRARAKVAPEFSRPADGLDISYLDSRDAYADRVGFVDGFPVAGDGDDNSVWLAHCYGMLGVGRDDATDSGNGSSLYVVTGHAPRHLDRNVVLVGKVLRGMEMLSTLERGSGQLGFYVDEGDITPVISVQFASDLPAAERLPLEVLRTDTQTFRQLVSSRQFRHEPWFAHPVGKIGLCNVPIPVRVAGPTGSP
jgi:peptidylprolyl isomerase